MTMKTLSSSLWLLVGFVSTSVNETSAFLHSQSAVSRGRPWTGLAISTTTPSTKEDGFTSNQNDNDAELDNSLVFASVNNNMEELPLIQLALAGSLTTFFADLTMHPVDCIKTLQQSDMGIGMSFWQAASYLHEQDGVLGFLHGFLTYATSDALGGCLKFGVWETWKKSRFENNRTQPANIHSLIDLAIGAALAFVASSVLIVPGELLKQQLQMSYYDNLGDAIRAIASSETGIRGFYAGYLGVLYRDIPYTVLELGLYDVFKGFLSGIRKSHDENEQAEEMLWLDQLACAALTGAITAIATTPMDVVKTKLMVDHYASFGDAFFSTVQNHGVGALFSGLSARLGWIIPFTILYLPTYDGLKNLLQKRHNQHMENQFNNSGKIR